MFPPSLSVIRSARPADQTELSTIRLTAGDLPQSFDWRQSGFQGYTDIINQKCCGNCWSIGTSNSMALRYAIQQNSVCPRLSILHLAACDKQDNGCMGGLPTNAFEYIKQNGIPEVTADDLSFDSWCNSAASYCGGACSETLGPRQNISLSSQCNTGNFNLFYISKYYYNVTMSDKNTVNRDATITQMKGDIYNNGPVVVGFQVFQDFEAQNPLWPATNGIYVYDGISPLVGGHAVAVVGWGRGNAGSKYGTIDYWIVKNSWGASWGDNGYCKVAISTSSGINKDLYMDVPEIIQGNFFGGSVGVMTIENVSQKYKKNNFTGGKRPTSGDSPPANGGGGGGGSSAPISKSKKIIIITAAAIFIFILAILFFIFVL